MLDKIRFISHALHSDEIIKPHLEGKLSTIASFNVLSTYGKTLIIPITILNYQYIEFVYILKN